MAKTELNQVIIHKPLSSIPDDEVSLEELKRRFELYKEFDFWSVETDCRRFANMITIWKEKELYKHFYDSWEDYLANHIKRPEEWVNHIVEGVRLLDKSKKITADDAISAAIRVQKLIKNVPPLASPNTARKSKIDKVKVYELADNGFSQVDIAKELGCAQTSISYILRNRVSNIGYIVTNIANQENEPKAKEKGNSVEYLIRRMKRDCPEVLEEIGDGKKYKSVQQAAIAAGISKPKINIQIVPDETGGQIAARLYEKLTDEQLREMVDSITEYLDGRE